MTSKRNAFFDKISSADMILFASLSASVVCGKQAQHAPGFLFTAAPGADQFVEEQDSLRPELRKPRFQ